MLQSLITILDEGHMFDDVEGMMRGFFDGGIMMWGMMIGGMILLPLLTIWIYQDAQSHGDNAIFWALVVFLTMGLGIIIYALLRNSDSSNLTTSPKTSPPKQTHNYSNTNTIYSPPVNNNPKSDVVNKGGFCEECGASLEMEDNYCPDCGMEL
ncbi:MAG: zinc-ribbon domain-containing protein [Candidatus Hodarchaeales archaeon]|jgi:MFS family permease